MQANGYVKPLKFQDLVEAYNNDANTSWDMQKPYILQAAAAGLLGCLEGPNEMNNTWTGGGTHGVNNTADMTNNWAGPNGNVVQWASAIKSWVSANSAAPGMANVKILAPSIATGLQSDFASLPNLASLVDYGNVHYYAANGMPPNQGNCAANPGVGYFANIYHWCQAAEIPTGSLVVSECGQSTATTFNTPHSQAAYILNQIHDAAGIGARGFDIYCMFDPNSGNPGDYESNFGVFKTDGTAKPAAIALSALKHLFSLNLNYDDPANLTDTAPFTPAYNPAQLSVTGISCSSRVANAVVFPKSDGTTLISVTDEPALTDGNGNAVIPAQETATVNFGSTQSWSLYDILGADPLQPVASGKGSSVQVELNGYPMYLLLTPPNNYTATNTRTVTPIFSPTATPTITATPTPVPPVYAPCNGAGMALDGVLGESVWALSSLSSIPGTACSYSGCGATDAGASAQYKAAWNSTGLWIGVVVSDPGTLYANAAAPWNGSGVEVFLDLNNTKAGYNTATGNYNDANTYQFAICYNSSAVAEYHNATARTILAATTVNTGSGYTMEIEIPWAALGVGAPAAGSFSGLDVAVDVANAAGTARDHQIVAVNGSYNLYDQAPAQWWVLNYQACGVSSPTTSPTRTASATVTQTATPPRTASPSASPTRTLSATATATLSSSSTSSPSSTLTRTPPPTLTFTVTPSFTASPAGTLTHTPTWSETPTYPPTATRTPSHTPTFTRTGTPTASPSGTATLSVTASLTATLTPTPSATKTSTLTPSPFPSGTRTPSATPFNSATLSSTATPTASETVFATQTPTPILTASSTPSTFATPASQGTAVGDRGQGSGLESAFFTPNPVRNGKIGLVFKVNGQVEGLRARIYTSAYMKVADVAFESEGGYGNGWHYVTLDSTRLPKGLYFGVIEAAGKAAKASLMVF